MKEQDIDQGVNVHDKDMGWNDSDDSNMCFGAIGASRLLRGPWQVKRNILSGIPSILRGVCQEFLIWDFILPEGTCISAAKNVSEYAACFRR